MGVGLKMRREQDSDAEEETQLEEDRLSIPWVDGLRE